MNLLFIGGDMRYAKIIKDLKDKNNIYTIGYDNTIFTNVKKFNGDISNINIIVLPINGIKDDYSVDSEFSKSKVVLDSKLFDNCMRGVQIFTGKVTDSLKQMVRDDMEINNFLNDKEVCNGNSLITVEGILENLISNRGEKTIFASNIVILGYGNIGKPLASILNGLGANLVVGVKDYNDYLELYNKKIKVFDTFNQDEFSKYLKCADTIINTVPQNILTKELISDISDECYILDISSVPYGARKDDIKDKNYFIYSKIPAKYSPVSSGHLLEMKMRSISGGKL